ncbi:MAG: twin-arginine translocase subunit TatB, partial [Aestuariivirga sp.]
MFDFGLSASHILVIVVLAVIAIGPKDLPVVLRRFGQFMNRMRGMARDFQGQVDSAMKDAGMDGIRQDLQTLKSGVTAAMSPTTALMSGVTNSAMSATTSVAVETSTPASG